MDAAGVLQEAGDADSRAQTRLCYYYMMRRRDGKVGGGSFVLGFRCGDKAWIS